MACQRRTICSAKFITGLLFGVVMGFVMGSIHLALMRSDVLPVTGKDNPCAGLGIAFDIDSKNGKRSDVIPDGVNFVKTSDEKKSSRNFLNIDEYEGELKDFEIESMFNEQEVDKIYEVDSSKFDQLQKHEIPELSDDLLPMRMEKLKARYHVIDKDLNKDAKFLYIGVMTAGKYVPTRGKAIIDTWAREVPGKVELYVGEDASGISDDISAKVVQLRRVDDTAYPPQKKSFMMLKHMYDRYIDGYEWFMRADDDIYLKPKKLEKLLMKLNSSQPLFIGQMGFGNEEERGKLTLDDNENYCMGGPGMVFSREVIRRIAPNIGKCLGNMYTNHEDVEVSRCVNKYAGVKCTWSYEMRELFYEHYSKRTGYINPDDVSLGNELQAAITLHPNKKPEYQRILHNHFLSLKIKELQAKLSKLYRAVITEDNALGRSPGVEEFMLGIPTSLNRYRPANGNSLLIWNFFSERLYSPSREMPRRGTPTYLKLAAKDIILQTIDMMNQHADTKGRVISYKRINYAYVRVNPIFGTEYVLDLLLHYNRYRGKKVTLPVRRHAYLQQTFARTEMFEDPQTDLIKRLFSKPIHRRKNPVKLLVEKALVNPLRALWFGRKFALTEDETDKKHFPVKYDLSEFTGANFPIESDRKRSQLTVNLIIPLSGRFLTFQRFMANLETVAFSKGESISILIMLFVSSDLSQRKDLHLTKQLISDYNRRFPQFVIRSLPVAGEFSRGLALEIGASEFPGESLLFFCDVDVIFNPNFLHKCRSNTIRGKSVYYPVLFSEFDPSKSSPYHAERDNHFQIDEYAGYWRGFGYGLLCVYQSDFASTGGFDTAIKGWGLEDVDLFGKFVHKEKEDSNAVTAQPFRVKDSDLIHVHHPSHCDSELESKQMTMCISSRNSNIMSVSNLYKKWRETELFENERDKHEAHHSFNNKVGLFFEKGENER